VRAALGRLDSDGGIAVMPHRRTAAAPTPIREMPDLYFVRSHPQRSHPQGNTIEPATEPLSAPGLDGTARIRDTVEDRARAGDLEPLPASKRAFHMAVHRGA